MPNNLERQQGTTSIVIPTYNRGYCIQRCIASLLSQTYPDLEVLVVDDGSTDDTRSVISKIDDPRVKLFGFDDNIGHPERVVFGMRAAIGEYVVFFGSDDYMANATIISDAVERLKRAPRDVWVVTYPFRCENRQNVDLKFTEEILDLRGYVHHRVVRSIDVLHIYRRQFIECFLRLYTEPYTFFTSFLEVYLRYHCRQLVVPKVGALAGFAGDNITRGKGGARYELWAEQAALRQFRLFRDCPAVHESDWWRARLLKTIYWSLAGTTLHWPARFGTGMMALTQYSREFGVDARSLLTFVGACLPFGLPRRLRRLRDLSKRYRQ